MNWIISQYWKNVVFVNFKVPVDLIQKRLPKGLEVDIYDDSAFVSVVPFHMSQVRFPYFPVIPFSSLWELNIRTYVKIGDKKGIYFFTLDTDHFFASAIAKIFFHLPYRYKKIGGKVSGSQFSFNSQTFSILGTVGKPLEQGLKSIWLTERYKLFVERKKIIFEGSAIHDKWKLREFFVQRIENNFLDEFHFSDYTLDSVFWGEPLAVSFPKFFKI